ncbi:hypothetical protein SARC_18243, partial [Sphaeroforma arctica JP610]
MEHPLMIQQFMEVTGDNNVDNIIQLLEAQNWDLESAVQLYLAGGLGAVWEAGGPEFPRYK